MTKHTDGKWTRSMPGTKQKKQVTANLQATKQKQQWCFLCAEPHDYHKDERNV